MKKNKKEGLLKRLKNIECKNEEQLEAIKGQGEKQLNAIKKNNLLKVKKKDDKTKDIVYLSERLNKFNKLYPNSFSDKVLDALEKLVINEKKIDCKSLSYKILFYDEDSVRSHEMIFWGKCRTLAERFSI